jgi:F-type H+-transporting ATPase subunit alpha
MAFTLFGVNNGYFDDVPVAKALAAEKALHKYMATKHADLTKRIEDTKDLSKDDEAALHAAVKDFKANGSTNPPAK